MQRLAILLLTLVALPLSPENGPALQKITVAELEQVLNAAHGRPDAEVARELVDMELTERLSTAKLAHWSANLRGSMTWQALIALADTSAFLEPPATEIPAIAKPNLSMQSKIVSQAANYVFKNAPRLPNFFATKDTAEFQDILTTPNNTVSMTNVNSHLHYVGSSSATVLYRDGREVREVLGETGAKDARDTPSSNGLNAWGVFGPLLSTVMEDVLRGKMIWSHWEQGPTGPLAVFRYEVLEGRSHYEVSYCCVGSNSGDFKRIPSPLFETVPGYHGEIAVDPVSGAILRLVLQTDLQPTLPIVRADTIVEYGPEEIGGETYICPVKSVSASKSAVSSVNAPWFYTGTTTGPKMTTLNDAVFRQYHLFRGETRILPQGKDERDTNPTAPVPPAVSHEP